VAEHDHDLAALALAILDEPERAEAQEHVRSCAQCDAELRDYQRVTDTLPQALALESPPPGAWDNIASRIREGRPAAAPADGRLRGWLSRPFVTPAAVAVLLLVVIGLAVWNGVLQYRLANDGESTGSITVYLRSLDSTSDARGQLRMTPDERLGGLVVSNLPRLTGSDTYTVWFVRPDQSRMRIAAFPVDALGQAIIELEVPQPLDQFEGVGISRETEAVSSPTSVDLLAGIIYAD
jgi:anti-sigma-K factor RskA